MFKELKQLLIPRKLWILRLYIVLLSLIVEFLLAAYVFISIYNLLASDTAFGDLVLGYAGLYLVWICLAILFIVQAVSMFLNIHDNIEVLRNKAVDPDFKLDLEKEKDKQKEASSRSIAIIATIILSIILSFINLNRDNSHGETSQNMTEESKIGGMPKQSDLNYNQGLNTVFSKWAFLASFNSLDNIRKNNFNEVCDNDYCVSFTQVENLLIVSHSVKQTVESHIIVYDLQKSEITFSDDYYVSNYIPGNNELIVNQQGYDNGRYEREGKLNLASMELIWGDKNY